MTGYIRNPKTYENVTDITITSYSLPLECQLGVTGKVTLLGKGNADYTNMLLFIEDIGQKYWKITSTENGTSEETTLTVKDATAVFEDVKWYGTYHTPPTAVTDMVVRGNQSAAELDAYYFMMGMKATAQASGAANKQYSYKLQRCYNSRVSKYAPARMIMTYKGEDDIQSPSKETYGDVSSAAQTYIDGLELDITEVISDSSENANLEIPSLESAVKAMQQHGAIVALEYIGVDYGVFQYRLPFIGDRITYNGKTFIVWGGSTTLTTSGLKRTVKTTIESTSASAESSSASSDAKTLWQGTLASSSSTSQVVITAMTHGSAVPSVGDLVRWSADGVLGAGIITSIVSSSSSRYVCNITELYMDGVTYAEAYAAGIKTWTQNDFGGTMDCFTFSASDTKWDSHNIQPTVVIDVSEGETETIPIYFNDGHSFLAKESYSNDIVSYVQLIDINQNKYAYYLNSSLSVVNDPTAQIQGQSVYKISEDSIADWNAGLTVANEVFDANTWSHQIEFKSDKTYHIGQPVKLMLERGILDTAIDKVWIESGDNLTHYTCGSLPTTATEHIKANSWTYGKRLPLNPVNGQLHFVTN